MPDSQTLPRLGQQRQFCDTKSSSLFLSGNRNFLYHKHHLRWPNPDKVGEFGKRLLLFSPISPHYLWMVRVETEQEKENGGLFTVLRLVLSYFSQHLNWCISINRIQTEIFDNFVPKDIYPRLASKDVGDARMVPCFVGSAYF